MIYLKNCTYINSDTLEFAITDIAVEEGLEGNIHFYNTKPDRISFTAEIDCKGKLVTHAFANGHHHVYSALARGMGAPKKNPVNFLEVLQYIWWTLDKCLDKDMIKASALVTAIACAKNGVSFVIDHHASPMAINDSLQIIADAFDKVGVSHLLCYEITDRDGLDKTEIALEETKLYLKTNQALVGLHAGFTVSDDTLQKAVNLANNYNTGIHIHVAEDAYDQENSMANYRIRVIERLQSHAALESGKTILGHCLYLNDSEKAIIANSNAWVVQNMESNLNNRVGYFNGCDIGNRIMLGTDGMHSDMLQSARSVFLSGKDHEALSPLAVYQRFRKVHDYIKINKFKGDATNNLVILDYDSPTDINSRNFAGHFVYGITSKHVRHVISNGKLIVKDGIVTTVNEAEILEFSREMSKKLWAKMQR
ncbi:MAG: amidohydrolase family protein [Bacteroidetes bacterium]|nr:amidohydrolase family protein [Bacteroidota bacterium]